MVAAASSLTRLEVETMSFPPSVKPLSSKKTMYLGGAGQFEKFYGVTLVYPLTGSKFVEKVEADSIAIMKSAGVYGDAEMRATENFDELFQKENLPPKTGFSIIYTQSPAGSLPVRFSKDGSIPEEGNVIVNKALSEAVLDSIIGKNGVSLAAKRSLAERLSQLFKANANSVAAI